MVLPTAICEHFGYSRAELTAIIAARRIRNIRGILARLGRDDGCACCVQSIEQILSELNGRDLLQQVFWDRSRHSFRDLEDSKGCEDPLKYETTLPISRLLKARYARIRQAYSLEIVVTENGSGSSPAQWADVGVIVRPGEYQIYVCGQEGTHPRAGFLLAMCRNEQQLLRTLDRFLTYYLLTADPYTRTAAWRDMLEEDERHVRRVIIADTLRVGAELDEIFQQFINANSSRLRPEVVSLNASSEAAQDEIFAGCKV